MAHKNVFAGSATTEELPVLTHAQSRPSSRERSLQRLLEGVHPAHADAHGIKQTNTLFPDAKGSVDYPEFIKRKTGLSRFRWCCQALPPRIRTPLRRHCRRGPCSAGYIMGNKKEDEVFTLLQRTTRRPPSIRAEVG